MGHARDIGTGIPGLLMRPSRALRARLVFVVLLALVVRAAIPVGFMPAADGSLSLVICPGGLPAALLPDRSTSQDVDQGMGQDTDQRRGMRNGVGNGKAHSMAMFGGMQMPMHRHRGHGSMDTGYCAFTTGFSSAPPPPLLAALLLLLACLAVIAVSVPAPAGIRLVHVPQARAPPRAV